MSSDNFENKYENFIEKDDSFDFFDEENNDKEIININNNDIIQNIYLEEKNTLISMGFKEDLINKIYKNIHPVNLQEALDYLNKDEKDKFTHSFIPNNRNVCLICEEKRNAHADGTLITDDVNDFIAPTTNRVHRDSLEKYRERKGSKKGGYSYLYKIKCGICEEEIDYSEKNKIILPCKHYFCISCWFDYLKEKINNANVYKINCMEHECDYSLTENFVKSIIGQDTQLLQKYDKFLTRRKLMESNKKIKFCPFPDCDGYGEKKNKKEKIVKCNFGHEFCFDCGNKLHPNQKCSDVIDKDFERWKAGRIVKRCPHCKFWTEKNEGCNHMTCIQCKFQWCWLCQKECLLGHYSSGPCSGLHFKSEISEEKTKQLLEENKLKYPPKSLIHRILVKFGFFMVYLFLCPYLYVIGKGIKYMQDIYNPVPAIFFGLSLLPFLVCAEIQTVTFVIIISIPAIFIPPYFKFLRYVFFSRIFGTAITV